MRRGALEHLAELDRVRPGLATTAYYRARAVALGLPDEELVLDALFEVSKRGGYDAQIARQDDLLWVVREARRSEFDEIVDEWQAPTALGRALSPPSDAVLTTRQRLSVPGDGGHLVAVHSERAFTVVDIAAGEVVGGLPRDAGAGYWVLERTGRWAARLSEAGVLEAWRFGPFQEPERVATLPLLGRIAGDERGPMLDGEARDLRWFEPGRSLAVRIGVTSSTSSSWTGPWSARSPWRDCGSTSRSTRARPATGSPPGPRSNGRAMSWRSGGRVAARGLGHPPRRGNGSASSHACTAVGGKVSTPLLSPGRDRVAFVGMDRVAVIGFSPQAKGWSSTPALRSLHRGCEGDPRPWPGPSSVAIWPQLQRAAAWRSGPSPADVWSSWPRVSSGASLPTTGSPRPSSRARRIRVEIDTRRARETTQRWSPAGTRFSELGRGRLPRELLLRT